MKIDELPIWEYQYIYGIILVCTYVYNCQYTQFLQPKENCQIHQHFPVKICGVATVYNTSQTILL